MENFKLSENNNNSQFASVLLIPQQILKKGSDFEKTFDAILHIASSCIIHETDKLTAHRVVEELFFITVHIIEEKIKNERLNSERNIFQAAIPFKPTLPIGFTPIAIKLMLAEYAYNLFYTTLVEYINLQRLSKEEFEFYYQVGSVFLKIKKGVFYTENTYSVADNTLWRIHDHVLPNFLSKYGGDTYLTLTKYISDPMLKSKSYEILTDFGVKNIITNNGISKILEYTKSTNDEKLFNKIVSQVSQNMETFEEFIELLKIYYPEVQFLYKGKFIEMYYNQIIYKYGVNNLIERINEQLDEKVIDSISQKIFLQYSGSYKANIYDKHLNISLGNEVELIAHISTINPYLFRSFKENFQKKIKSISNNYPLYDWFFPLKLFLLYIAFESMLQFVIFFDAKRLNEIFIYRISFGGAGILIFLFSLRELISAWWKNREFSSYWKNRLSKRISEKAKIKKASKNR